jgi:hypothetical protein
MRAFKLVLFIVLIMINKNLSAQALTSVCISYPYPKFVFPFGVYNDSINNNKILHGYCTAGAPQFEKAIKSDSVGGCFDNVSFYDTIFGETRCMVRYQGDLWVGGYNGVLPPGGGVGSTYAAQLIRISPNGTATLIPVDQAGTVYGMKVLNGELYVFGDFDTIAGMRATCIAKYDGTTWSNFPIMYYPDPIIGDVEWYQGELYVSGLLDDPGLGLRNFGKFNGTSWQDVGGGFPNPASQTRPMVVYNNKLVVGGGMHTSQGDVGNMIQQWDGTSWTPLGNGFDGPGLGRTYVLKIINGELWAGGMFYRGSTITNIAKWNGSTWNGMGLNFSTVCQVWDIEQINNEVYVVGNFPTVNGDSTLGKVFKIIIPVGLNEQSKTNITLAPNPATDEIELSNFQIEKESFINILDVSGRFVSSNQLQPSSSNKYKFNISNLTQGCYLIEVNSGGKILRQKFVKL